MTDNFRPQRHPLSLGSQYILTRNTLVVGDEQDTITENLGLSPLLLNVAHLSLTD